MPKQYELNIEGHKIVAIAYNEDTNGTPVFFIHGITGSVSFWEGAQTPIIDKLFRWYSLSLPGHFPAAFPEHFKRNDLTAEMIGRILSQAIRELVGEQAVLLVGHSTGGFAALCIAQHSPEIVAGLVSVSGFAHGRWIGGLGVMQMLVRLGGKLGERAFVTWYWLNQKSKLINRPMWRIYAANSRQMYLSIIPAPFDAMHRDFTHLDLEGMVSYFARMPDIDITNMLQKIETPTLALAGERDPIVPPTQAKTIADTVQNGDLKYLSKTGHLPMFESPEAYHEIITNWIESNFVQIKNS